MLGIFTISCNQIPLKQIPKDSYGVLINKRMIIKYNKRSGEIYPIKQVTFRINNRRTEKFEITDTFENFINGLNINDTVYHFEDVYKELK